ncbi:hypothetical protein SEMRO_71_G039600.1 [Seminavis robusta]|uniref:Uncharacterized protein n=1 Tax=Seminavis robusta TaxID=568900 RepID=A0A9N8H3X9_9STRA|nr:hypothetical protein SEMRO_71_G039600.1 [Seminavis robusta]|eukprot:Sro71_g039600.1 n/a (201) ;mRNA; f:121535-122137
MFAHAKAVRALVARGKNATDQRLSSSHSGPPTSDHLTPMIFNRGTTQPVRDALLADTRHYNQFMIIVDNKPVLFANPQPFVDPAGHTWLIGNLSDKIGEVVPAKIPFRWARSHFTALAPGSVIEKFKLTTSEQHPDDISGPAPAGGTHEDAEPPSTARITLEPLIVAGSEPGFCCLPCMYPWPKGFPFPKTTDLVTHPIG